MEHGEIGVRAFLPAGEDAAEAVEPRVGALDDPVAGAEAGLTFERLRFFAPAPDLGGEAELLCEIAHLAVIVALAEAQLLRLLERGLGSLDGDRLDRVAAELEVVQVRARWPDPERDALALAKEAPFCPFFALSVGLGPVRSPPSGALPMAPSIASHSHSIPTWSS